MSASPTAAPLNPLAMLPKVPSLNNTFGAFLLATFIGLIMYGLTLHQTYRYYRLFPGDVLVLRVIVVITLVLETLHIVLCMHVCYYYLVSPVATVAVILISQTFFTRRVYLIGARFRAIVAVIPVLMLVTFGFGVAATVEAFIRPTFADFEKVAWMTSAGFGVAAIVDTLLTGTLILALQKSRTGFKGTDSLIDVLIMYAVNTGFLTGIFSIISLILALVLPKDLIYSAVNIIAAKLYANSLLAVLNSRSGLMDRVPQDCFDTGTLNLSALKDYSGDSTSQTWSVPRPRRGSTQIRLPNVNVSALSTGTMLDIRVNTERVVHMDAESIELEHKGSQPK